MMAQAASIIDELRRRKLAVATAESCTGGMLAAALTDVPGSSDVFGWGLVTYSNEAKAQLLGVSREVYERSAFVRQSGLAISQDAELEKRIAEMISTGAPAASLARAVNASPFFASRTALVANTKRFSAPSSRAIRANSSTAETEASILSWVSTPP